MKAKQLIQCTFSAMFAAVLLTSSVHGQENAKTALPAEFASVPETIVMTVPAKGPTIVPLKGANLGRAFVETRAKGANFAMGLYDQTTKKYLGFKAFRPGEIQSGKFDFYLINKTPLALTPSTLCYGGSWRLNYFVGKEAVKKDDAKSLKQKFYIFVSLREDDGKIYSDRAYLVPAEKATRTMLLPREPGRTALPESLNNVAGVIEIAVPKYSKTKVADTAANFQRALPEVWDGKTMFRMGLYHGATKKYSSARILKGADVPMDGKYHLIKLADTADTITPSTVFYSGKWTLAFQLGHNVQAGKKYYVFVSLKREENRLLGDKVVLVPEDKCPAGLK